MMPLGFVLSFHPFQRQDTMLHTLVMTMKLHGMEILRGFHVFPYIILIPTRIGKLKYESFIGVLGRKQTELIVLIYKSVFIICTPSFLFIQHVDLNFDCSSLEDIIRLHYHMSSTTLLCTVQVKDIMFRLYKATKSSLRSITPKEIKLLKHLLNIIDPEERFSALATAFSPGDEHEAKDPNALYT